MLSTNWRGYRLAAWGGQLLLGIALVVAVFQRNFPGVLTLACFLQQFPTPCSTLKRVDLTSRYESLLSRFAAKNCGGLRER